MELLIHACLCVAGENVLREDAMELDVDDLKELNVGFKDRKRFLAKREEALEELASGS